MIKITHRYKSNLGAYKQKTSRKAVSKIAAQYPNTNVKLTNSKIIMDSTLQRPVKIKIKAQSENPELQVLGKHKAVLTQKIYRGDGRNYYNITFDNALEKILEHFKKQEQTYTNLEQKSKTNKTNYPFLKFLRKTLSLPVKL